MATLLPAYEGRQPSVFVCYSNEDNGMVYPELVRLQEAGFYLCYEQVSTPAAASAETLARRIRDCKAFLFFVTPRSVATERCMRGANLAVDQSCTVLFVHLEPTRLPNRLGSSLDRQTILAYEDPPAVYRARLDRAIADALAEKRATAPGGERLLIGDWLLDAGSQRLERDGQVHTLDPKQMAVLLHLANRAPRLVTHESLLARNWPGVVVGDNVLHQVIRALRRLLGDDARHPRFIETLPKRGYRLLVPVAPALVSPAEGSHILEAEPSAAAPPTPVRRTTPYTLLSAMAAVALAALLGALWMTSVPTTIPTGPRPDSATSELTLPVIAVHPLEASGGDPALVHFAERTTTQLVAALAKVKGLRVVGTPGSAASEHALEGSVRREGDRLRLEVRLAALPADEVLWAHEFPMYGDSDAFQKAGLVAQAVEGVIFWHQQTRWATDDPSLAPIYREYRNGMIEWHLWAQGAGGNTWVAGDHWRRAIQLDPLMWPAHQQLLIQYANRFEQAQPLPQFIDAAHEAARQLMALRAHDARFRMPVTWEFPVGTLLYRLDLDYDNAERLFLAARDQGWHAGEVAWELANLNALRGDLDSALTHYNAAVQGGARLNQSLSLVFLGWAHLAAGHYGDAARVLHDASNRTVEGTSLNWLAQILRIMALALLDDVAAAERLLDVAWTQYGALHPEWFPGVLALVGRDHQARELLARTERRFQESRLLHMASSFHGHYFLGELDEAFVWLDRVIENREWQFLPTLRRAPYLDPIRQDPRFLQAIARLDALEALGSPLRRDIDDALDRGSNGSTGKSPATVVIE